ncbi:uncharacterized protein LOC110989653 [Acanthaster planci]|uniref:Uncharacterized protein LOC110989653 n=1 Tax=Acanthaster planci TaxID=133434 RepID=A0A8B7ZYR2_ACAPL|nr:uncharacterized protein LOC110989653 [Acanthaster planci]
MEAFGSNTTCPKQALLSYVNNNVIGGEALFRGPFGQRRVIYCDYTASGRPLRCIENYISEYVYSMYANTHTTTTVTSKQTTQFRHEARELIRSCVNATEDDAVIFTGSGSTGAIHKLLNVMELHGEKAARTMVLVGPFEHHSNILPWRESGARVVRIQQTANGLVDLADLESKLQTYCQKYDLILGCFSAASNVTGIITDTKPVAALLHHYGALSFWDYATAAPYLDIDMNPEDCRPDWDCSKDAVFISTHKFVGGVGTPGLLIAKKCLFVNKVPHGAGGGTVAYVSRDMYHYLRDIEAREEGGTPAIVESIRAGLAFQIKHAVGVDHIEEREEQLARYAFEKWQSNENLLILGNKEVSRLPIFSFMIRHQETGKLLHHNFVSVLLNDLFGIQARGGCACAGPYAHDLLGISEDSAVKFYELLREDRRNMCNEEPAEAVRPGFVRINLPYFATEETIDYVTSAIDMVATHGWKLLPQYRFDLKSGAWTHRVGVGRKGPGLSSLYDINYDHGFMEIDSDTEDQCLGQTRLEHYLQEARVLFDQAVEDNLVLDALQDPEVQLSEPYQDFLWFVQPREAAVCLHDAWSQTLQQALKSGYVFVIEDGCSEVDSEVVIDRYGDTMVTPLDQEDAATVPHATLELSHHGYGESFTADFEDVAVVPGDEVDTSDPFTYHGDMEMYTGTVSSAFDFTKPGHGVSYGGLDGEFEPGEKPRSRHPSLCRAFSNESGYRSDEEFTYAGTV